MREWVNDFEEKNVWGRAIQNALMYDGNSFI
jgi:hypothetical protein